MIYIIISLAVLAILVLFITKKKEDKKCCDPIVKSAKTTTNNNADGVSIFHIPSNQALNETNIFDPAWWNGLNKNKNLRT